MLVIMLRAFISVPGETAMVLAPVAEGEFWPSDRRVPPPRSKGLYAKTDAVKNFTGVNWLMSRRGV
jgi:hypothetical protein